MMNNELLLIHKISEKVNAYVYFNGVINIEGTKYLLCSLDEAIEQYKQSILDKE